MLDVFAAAGAPHGGAGKVVLHGPTLVSACTGGCPIPSTEEFAPGVLAMPLHSYERTPGAQALALSTNGGASFSNFSAWGTAPDG